jgi:hypothetical protein
MNVTLVDGAGGALIIVPATLIHHQGRWGSADRNRFASIAR